MNIFITIWLLDSMIFTFTTYPSKWPTPTELYCMEGPTGLGWVIFWWFSRFMIPNCQVCRWTVLGLSICILTHTYNYWMCPQTQHTYSRVVWRIGSEYKVLPLLTTTRFWMMGSVSPPSTLYCMIVKNNFQQIG